ncbi:peptide ABC transporter substrate-binding protein [Lacticaseibacillus hulanensis]|uniref:peptide ABC transporter substrate-binding protein n=1 Tax=Lacticaseibacillus hulanensis TaxID=2493111 RepID=UPI0019D48AFB|nr:peptide ABC transporter substrate-binding protein [Lacticaseibacillus hulanensis]
MKMKKKGLVLAAVASAALLAACGNSKSSSDTTSNADKTYSYVYSTDPDNFDYTVTSRQTNSQHLSNFEDGLLERNQYGELKPDLAKSWKVSKDGKTYTYTLRKGVKWVDSNGNSHGTVKAQDFVTGLKHAVAAKSETLYVVQGSIKGLNDYVTGKTKDFSTVGVKALNDHTVQYTLNAPETYWNSKLTYGVMYPVQAKFLASKGKNFGKVGTDGILYNGPFVLSNFTSKSVMQYKKNDSYWDKKNVHLSSVKLTYNDGTNPDGLYKSFKKGDFTAARVYPTSAQYKTVQKENGNNIIWSDQDSSVYNMTFNFNRRSFNLTSKKTDKQKQDAHKAILNKDFRLAIQAAFDKTAYNAQSTGNAGASKSLRNTMTPYTFVQADGKDYGSFVEKDLAKDDPANFKGVDLKDQQDATYNKAKAKKLFAEAKKQLSKEGVSFPVKLDLPADEKTAIILNQDKSLKNSLESVLGKKNIEIDIQTVSEDKYLAATYAATTGAASDYDISNASGWSPDYDDPSTYLEIYNPDTGSMLQTLGMEASANVQGKDPSAAIKKQVGFDKYAKMLATAEAIKTDANARNKAFAKAEAWLLDNAVQIPINSLGGTPSVTKVVPKSGPYAPSGLGAYRFKFTKVQDKPVTKAQYDKAKKAWTAKRAEIAKQEDK